METKKPSIANFPTIVEGKIPLTEYLEAAKSLVELVDRLGKLFAPLTYDMTQNIQKIERVALGKNFQFLEDVLIAEKADKLEIASEGLLWLNRALNFLSVFYQFIVNDLNQDENVQSFLERSYKISLEPYHGFITRGLFIIFKRAFPSRSVILKILQDFWNENDKEDVLKKLREFCIPLSAVVEHTKMFYDQNGFDTNRRAP